MGDDIVEMTNPEAPSSLFADEESSSSSVDSAAINGGLESNNESDEAAVNYSSPKPRGSVTFSIKDDKEDKPSDDAHDRENIGFSKQSTCSTDTVGFTEVHERAPNINLRTFRQAERRKPRRNNGVSLLHRLRESSSRRKFLNWAKETGQVSHGNEHQADTTRPIADEIVKSVCQNMSTSNDKRQRKYETRESEILIEAHLVEEEELEYAVAEEISFWQRYSKILIPSLCFFVIILVTLVSVSVTQGWGAQAVTEMPSQMPSVAPSQDPRPTLAIVQERGYLLCELAPGDTPEKKFWKEICRSVAAAVLGNPDSFKAVDPPPYSERWTSLQGASVDLMINGDTRTVEREVNEELTFSTPYYYDGASYNGKELYVNCAYDQKRHQECEDLFICTIGSAGDYIEDHFSPVFYYIGTSVEELYDMYRNGTCNVIAGDRFSTASRMHAANFTDYVIGANTFTNEPLAVVTRSDESEWSDIVNWVMQALFYGEKVGRGQNRDKCNNDTPATVASKLNYINAVDCVGNYDEIFSRAFGDNRNDINKINRGTEMLYVTPFGNVYTDDAEDEPNQVRLSMLHDLMSREIRCGIVVQSGCEDGNITSSNRICGMSVDLCHTLAASINDGNANDVNFTIFQDEDGALMGLHNGTIDVLLGLENDFNKDFGEEVGSGGVSFSMPYFYGNESGIEPVTVYSIATIDNDPVFASYVNSIILATVYAVRHRITKDSTLYMPAMTLFGKYFLWALKDAIEANGNYDEIYESNFGDIKNRGRNALNKLQSPQMFNNPGLVSKPFPTSGAFWGRLHL